MYLPAILLLKILSPNSSPNTIKIPLLRIPTRRLYLIERLVVLLMLFRFLVAAASEIVGSRRTDREFVTVDGNIIKGFAIAFNIPYILRASACSSPYFLSKLGIRIASTLVNILIISRFKVKGKDIFKIDSSKGFVLLALMPVLFAFILICFVSYVE